MPDMTLQKVLESAQEYTVGWIAALPLELAAAITMLDAQHDKPRDFVQDDSDNNVYSWGSIGDHNVVLTSLAAGVYGTVSAAVTAQQLLSSFPHIRIGLMVGIGAALPSLNGEHDIRLGDIVVSQPDGQNGGVVQYDLGKAMDGGQFERRGMLNMPPQVLLKALSKLQAHHEFNVSRVPDYLAQMLEKNPLMAKSMPGRSSYRHPGRKHDRLFKPTYTHVSGLRDCSNCNEKEQVYREVRESEQPAIFYGTIASGDTLCKDAVTRDLIANRLGGMCICLEMEAAGLMNNFPCIVIRGICDYADSHKNDLWQRYAAATAAAYAKEFLGIIPSSQLDRSPTALSVIRRDIANIAKDVITMRKDVKSIAKLQNDENRRKLCNWLSPDDFTDRLNDYLRERHPGTGEWFLQTPEVQQWLTGEQRFLFCHGIPGAGKTMMASILVEHLRSRRQNGSLDGHPGVAFAYCTHREQGQQSLDTVLSSLLAQLALDLPIIYSTLQELYSSNFGKARLSSKDILSELHSAVSSYSNVSIVIDALDECERDATRKALLSALHLLQKASDVRIMVTARTDMALNFLNHAQKMEICANTRDIHRYLRGRVSELPMVVQDSPKLQEKIATLTSFSIIKTIPAYSFEPSATSFAS